MAAVKKRILLVEDEKDMVEIMTFHLESKGYEVLAAYDGLEGLEKAKSGKVDIIILDIMLPKIDGYKVCGLLKKDSRYSDIPIIILTARGQESDRAMGMEAGADAFMSKPFEPQVLLDKIKELTVR